jgi:hypothetical protein
MARHAQALRRRRVVAEIAGLPLPTCRISAPASADPSGTAGAGHAARLPCAARAGLIEPNPRVFELILDQVGCALEGSVAA